MDQLGELENDRAAFEEKGVQIIALAVQSQEEAASSIEKSKAQYPILADAEHTVAELYGVFDLLSGVPVKGKATPSVFIIEQNGQIVWAYIASNISDRVSSKTILENLPK